MVQLSYTKSYRIFLSFLLSLFSVDVYQLSVRLSAQLSKIYTNQTSFWSQNKCMNFKSYTFLIVKSYTLLKSKPRTPRAGRKQGQSLELIECGSWTDNSMCSMHTEMITYFGLVCVFEITPQMSLRQISPLTFTIVIHNLWTLYWNNGNLFSLLPTKSLALSAVGLHFFKYVSKQLPCRHGTRVLDSGVLICIASSSFPIHCTATLFYGIVPKSQ